LNVQKMNNNLLDTLKRTDSGLSSLSSHSRKSSKASSGFANMFSQRTQKHSALAPKNLDKRKPKNDYNDVLGNLDSLANSRFDYRGFKKKNSTSQVSLYSKENSQRQLRKNSEFNSHSLRGRDNVRQERTDVSNSSDGKTFSASERNLSQPDVSDNSSDNQIKTEVQNSQNENFQDVVNEAAENIEQALEILLNENSESGDLSLDTESLKAALAAQSSVNQANSADQASENQGALLASGLGDLDGGDAGDSSDDGDMSSDKFLLGAGKILQGNQKSTGAQFLKALSQVQQNSSESSIDNLPSVIKSLQSTIKEGGGSMKIQLSPEGMGHLNLNIAVQDGRVNVEMTAENESAKMALEESLADIKSSLENQKLLVDTLKVELNSDLKKDFTDAKNFLADEQNRDLAQQFMEQFHRDRDQRSMNIFNGFRSYLKDPADPDTVLDRSGLYRHRGQGQRLNVVA